jgi:hypothetical protein
MQNDELRESRAEVEAGLERYTELYDFAPVGYLTLGRDLLTCFLKTGPDFVRVFWHNMGQG